MAWQEHERFHTPLFVTSWIKPLRNQRMLAQSSPSPRLVFESNGARNYFGSPSLTITRVTDFFGGLLRIEGLTEGMTARLVDA